MAATGKTPILLYGSTTSSNVPSAGNLTNSSDGCEIAINVADKNLFFKDSTNAVNTVPIRQSSGSSDGWLSSANWTTFNNKQAALVSGTNIKTVNGTSLLGSGDLGTIGTGYGGTGLTSFTANGVLYASSTSALATGSNLTFNGTNLLGLHATTSAWNSSYDAIEFSGTAISNLGGGQSNFTNNVYVNSGGAWTSKAGGVSTLYQQSSGVHYWYVGPSVSAGANAGFVQAMQIANSGGVSIGNTTDPGATNLSVQGKALVGTATSLGSGVSVLSSDEAAYNLRNSGSSAGKKWTLGANAANTVELYNQGSAGVYIADGGSSWSSISDERLKDIIEPITNASAKVRQLRSVIGKYKTDDEGTRRSFLIAQDVKAAFPEAINEHALPNSDDKTEYLGVTYTDIIPLLVATINELQDRLDALENK